MRFHTKGQATDGRTIKQKKKKQRPQLTLTGELTNHVLITTQVCVARVPEQAGSEGAHRDERARHAIEYVHHRMAPTVPRIKTYVHRAVLRRSSRFFSHRAVLRCCSCCPVINVLMLDNDRRRRGGAATTH